MRSRVLYQLGVGAGLLVLGATTAWADTPPVVSNVTGGQRARGQASPPEEVVLIPGGEFQMGDHFSEGYSDERPVHAVNVGSFYMDVYEVTNQQYADALNWALGQGLVYVGDGQVGTNGVVYKPGGVDSYPYCSTTSAPTGSPHHGEWSRITWDGSTFGVTAGKEDHPMVMVSWYGAAAYANWRSTQHGRTPSYDLSTWQCNFAANGYRLPTEAEWGVRRPWRRVSWRTA
jgi:formylglycine-generating enzyme required for sulfatase activity